MDISFGSISLQRKFLCLYDVPTISVARFGEILPLWQNLKTLWPFFVGLLSTYLTNFWTYFGIFLMFLDIFFIIS